ncbi:MAG TPA: OmpA family protein, partial [Stellaceae bacterium]|nr:OmpA family protein [Stellaceae bacterium]
YTVYFDTNSFAINADGQKVVNDVIAVLQRNPASVATVIGRTDTVGSNDYNMHLSERRAVWFNLAMDVRAEGTIS